MENEIKQETEEENRNFYPIIKIISKQNLYISHIQR